MAYLISATVMLSVALIVFSLRGFMAEYRKGFTSSASLSLQEMFLFIDPQKLFFVNIIVLLTVPVLVWMLTGKMVLAIVVTIAAMIMPRFMYGFLKRRRLEKIIEQFPDALGMMAGSLRSGASLAIALDLVATEAEAPLSQELSLLLREQKLGISLDDAMESMSKRLRLEEIDLFVSAVTISKSVGGNLAEVLERLAQTLRSKAIMEGKIRALTSQGKLQGIVVGMLPIFMGVVLNYLEPEAMAPMFNTWYGWVVVGVISVLLIVGGILIRKIIAIDV
ncbi:MAG: type II secretion system F family protein [Burkholderiaceae bacterium]|jgi:tight adherence protein B|nr:type II secretion system F family protein [Burkholderiaceae bacterium]